MNEIGVRVKELRTTARMSQYELAEMVGVTQDMISKIERKDRRPSLPVAMKLAEVLGVTVDELVAPEVIATPSPESVL